MQRNNSRPNLINNQMIFNNTANNFYPRKKENENRVNTEQNKTKKAYAACKIVPPTEGIPFESVKSETKIMSGLKCSICYNLIWDPVEINECNHTFCNYCLNKWLKIKSFCPICKQSSINIRPSKAISRLCGELKIKCSNERCKETPEYSNYIEHLEKCKYKKYKCLNEGCKFTGIREEVKSHCLNCDNRLSDCKYCHDLIKFCELERHSKTECKQNYECPQCHIIITRGEYFSKHHIPNQDNIKCLKDAIKYHVNQYNKLDKLFQSQMLLNKKNINDLSLTHEDEIKKNNDKLNKIINERNNLYLENKNLKKELKNIEDSFNNLYNQLFKTKKNVNIINNSNDNNNDKNSEVNKLSNNNEKFQVIQKNFDTNNFYRTPRGSTSTINIFNK